MFNPNTRAEYLKIMQDLAARGAGAIILGCTEIGLLVRPIDLPDTPLYDSTALHVDRAVQLVLGLRAMPGAARLTPANR